MYDKASLHGQELTWRFAFHELLERDSGAAKWSDLEVLNFRFRRDTGSKRAYLDRVQILEMLSTSAVNSLLRPLSWGVEVGSYQNGEDLDHQSLQLQVRVGDSLDLFPHFISESALRWCLFVKASAQETPDLRYAGGIGGESFLLFKAREDLRIQTGFEKLFYPKWETQTASVRFNFDFETGWELVGEYREMLWSPQERSSFWTEDKLLRMQYQFLY
jgi:hypothetical protein